jgi:hypothetical protein
VSNPARTKKMHCLHDWWKICIPCVEFIGIIKELSRALHAYSRIQVTIWQSWILTKASELNGFDRTPAPSRERTCARRNAYAQRQHFCLVPCIVRSEVNSNRWQETARDVQVVFDDCRAELIISLAEGIKDRFIFWIRKKKVCALSRPMESCRGWRFCCVIREPRCTLPLLAPGVTAHRVAQISFLLSRSQSKIIRWIFQGHPYGPTLI